MVRRHGLYESACNCIETGTAWEDQSCGCRFANHRNPNNAFAKVMLVSGEHRIAIYAKAPLAAGDEIFYDYGYHASLEGYCPTWGDEDVRHSRARKKQVGAARSNASGGGGAGPAAREGGVGAGEALDEDE